MGCRITKGVSEQCMARLRLTVLCVIILQNESNIWAQALRNRMSRDNNGNDWFVLGLIV